MAKNWEGKYEKKNLLNLSSTHLSTVRFPEPKNRNLLTDSNHYYLGMKRVGSHSHHEKPGILIRNKLEKHF